ncbi:MAG: EAL domain-containing protein, partial [Kiloniellales bacterium]
VCAVAQDAKPQPIFHEIYTSIHLLQTVLLPDCDIHGNPWLFQDLTRHLDRRMIAGLTKNDDSTLKKAFSLNFNIATLLSPDFLAFDRALNADARRTIVIEVQLIDLLADMGGFLFAREFLRERGYRLCLDGTTHHSLPFADRARLGFDFVKLQWSPELADQLAGSGGEHLSRAVKLNDPARIIMTRCDSPDALVTGRKLGINIYQGYHLDRLLRQKTTSNEFIATLSRAMQRHRASQREAGWG